MADCAGPNVASRVNGRVRQHTASSAMAVRNLCPERIYVFPGTSCLASGYSKSNLSIKLVPVIERTK